MLSYAKHLLMLYTYLPKSSVQLAKSISIATKVMQQGSVSYIKHLLTQSAYLPMLCKVLS